MGDDLVFKVGGKMFAVLVLEPAPVWLSLKSTPEEFAELTERPGIIPAPYVARYHWIAVQSRDAVPAAELKLLLRRSYDLVFRKPEAAQEDSRCAGLVPYWNSGLCPVTIIAVPMLVMLFDLAGRQLFLMPLVVALTLSEALLMMVAIAVGAMITVTVMISVSIMVTVMISITVAIVVTIMIAPRGSALVIVAPFVMIGGSGQRRRAQPEHKR